MADDLDAFLQRAAQKRKKPKPEIVVLDDQPPAAQRPTERPGATAEARGPRPTRRRPPNVTDRTSPSSAPRTAPPPAPPRQTASPLETSVYSGESVEAHVQKHLDTHEFEDRASQLGAEVDLADDKLEAHLHQVFDHAVGSFSHVEQPENGPTPSASLFQTMFQSMDELRRAIVLREILERPRF